MENRVLYPFMVGLPNHSHDFFSSLRMFRVSLSVHMLCSR